MHPSLFSHESGVKESIFHERDIVLNMILQQGFNCTDFFPSTLNRECITEIHMDVAYRHKEPAKS